MNKVLISVLVLAWINMSDGLGAQDYFPLQPGNKWYYEWIGSEVILSVQSKPYEFNGIPYWAIVDRTPEVTFDSSRIVFEGKTYWLYSKGRDGMPIATMYYRKDSEGNVYWYDDELNVESLLIPKEFRVGDSWVSDDERIEFRVVTIGGTFKTRSSAFNDCLVISTKALKPRYPWDSFDPSSVFFHYYREGVGYVGSNPEDKSGMTLLRWEINEN